MKGNTLGIALMVVTMAIFASQDGLSRHLAESYNTVWIVTIRYWAYTAALVAIFSLRPGGLRAVARSKRPRLQFARGVLLALEILVAVKSFVLLGLVGAHTVFASFPLIVAALSGPVLGEKVGWRRWTAIAVGFIGVLILIDPTRGNFNAYILLPILSSVMFAFYQLLTRMVASFDRPETSFFWTGIGGAAVMTLVGPFFAEPMSAPDWGWMALLCLTALIGHFLLIKALSVAEAAVVQPFNYLHLVFVAIIGVLVFGETLAPNTVLGAAIVMAAGIFTLVRGAKRGSGIAKTVTAPAVTAIHDSERATPPREG